MKSYQVIRTHLSPYQAPDFPLLEKKTLEEVGPFEYLSLAEAKTERPTILITNTHTQLSRIPGEILSATELIVHPNSGYDHWSEEHQLWRDIPVVIGHEIRAQAVAEYSLACLFEGKTELPQHLSWNRERKWPRPLLRELTVAVFGYGHIGKIIADTVKTLGCGVLVIDPYVQTCPHRLYTSWKDVPLSEVHVVIAACTLNRDSFHLFDDEFFSNARKDLLFINGARGKLVSEKALREFLLRNPEAQAFLDVFENEPFGEEWHHFPQVWKTSHIAGVFGGLDRSILSFESKILSEYVSLSRETFLEKHKSELLQNKWIKGVLV